MSRCFHLTVRCSDEEGGSFLVQGPWMMLFRSVLFNFGGRVSVLVREMMFSFNEAARAGDAVLEEAWLVAQADSADVLVQVM